MNMRNLVRALAILSTLVFAACTTTVDVHTKVSPTADFSRYGSFSFGPTEAPPDSYATSSRSPDVEERVQTIVSRVLQSKGYVPADKPGIVVRIAAGVHTAAERWPMFVPRPPPARDSWFTENEEQEILEGALVIDVYDAENQELLWHGAAHAEIDPDHVDEQLIERSVAQILTTFPARR